MSTSPSEAARITYRYDLLRSPFYGILEAGWTTLSLVIAIRAFAAPETVKAFIVGAGPIGFLCAPLLLFAASHLRLTASRTGMLLFAAAAVFMAGAALATNLVLFASLLVLGQLLASQQNAVMVHIYDANYPASERGKRLGTPFVLVAVSAIFFSVFGGYLLDVRIDNYVVIFLIMAASAGACAWFLSRIPSEPLSPEDIGNPWQNFSLAWTDKLFGTLLFAWMILGVGNLLTLPIRVEYLADPTYGINADNTTIAFILLVIPAICRILSTKLWGHLFDRFHLITTRILLNLCFLLGIFLFFFTDNLIVMGIAMAFFGTAIGGGKIMWTLWVTKIAPKVKAASYMSVHMALTGLRGTLAPFLGYWVLSRTDPQTVGLFGSTLIVLASLVFARLKRHPGFSAAAENAS